MIDVIKDFAAVVGCIGAVIALIATISTNFRSWLHNKFRRRDEEIQQQSKIDELVANFNNYVKSDEAFKKGLQEDMLTQKDFAKNQCRNIIKDIFYRYCDERVIPLYEYKIATETFDIYSHKLKGNHYIALLYDEIKKWEIDYTHSFEEDEI